MSAPRVAIVTGSSSGIGEGIARALAADGFTVVVNSATSVDAGERLAAELPGASYVQADIADPSDAVRLVETAVARHGRLDLLVNNAGVSRAVPHADLDAVTADDWHRILGVNVVGTWQVSVAAVKVMEPGGQIVNISSVGGSRPLGSSIPYAISKAALDHMTRLLAKAVGPEVRVNAIAPGPLQTRLTSAGLATRMARTVAMTPMGRLGQPSDVAAMILALVKAPFVTGEVINVDGGINLVTHMDAPRDADA
ncbi:SDR family oxidoreductase [Nonomuraea fuscirosea]|uniref:SDR family NAD(P)-dependent oxidoreductase n=1 Tax=Nonomuraea fuscirosea TaxID=1291556 RepID=UPI002DD9E690|nr:SDR family oxidoreductase [Nonomuraea fuscirosea]WSA56970.1 SDR family oxidoreductase [Nonomuraea fuscirosea]